MHCEDTQLFIATVKHDGRVDRSSPGPTHPPAVLPADVPAPAKKLAMHMPQLDGVRGISAILVIGYHYTWWDLTTDYGIILLGLFFVLSGFLITGILLDSRQQIDDGRLTLWQATKTFFIRRFLRIFPLYYGVLVILYLCHFHDIKRRVLWHWFYLSNYYFSYVFNFKAARHLPPERHFWSLSVEEQFYILWPFVIFLLPRRLLPYLLGLFIVGAPVYRRYAYTPRTHAHEWMMPCCLDLLATGACLAILYRRAARRTISRLLAIAGVVGIVAMTANVVCDYLHVADLERAFYNYTVISVFGFWLIGTAATGFPGIVGKTLSHPVTTYLGRISYALYVFHIFTPYFVRWVALERFGLDENGIGMVPLFVICMTLTVLAAIVSWHVYESPINNLKRYFTYRKPSPTRIETPA